ncbi:DUF6495 family protein [Flavobacterium agricola]|uniref:DUF6495 family protein n=1 Tax=Flavobacterium agricola TaxID=2870839 RepID=A0ABY6M0T7_9FLAO|nr:DUF6495 family protein [Flavobacterium agricola]UYW02167.1 DUF6495 family protein [Flavobacterium agricola]
MKYTRLTKEQFEELNQEFSNFLASQQIDKNEWDAIKKNSPEVAEQELDVFSDLIWEGVLTNAKYLEHFAKNYIFLFECTEVYMSTIIIKALVPDVDFLTKAGLEWLGDHLFTEFVEIHRGNKVFDDERNLDIFKVIQQGAILSDGALYQDVYNMLEK